jgi:hypothetical protein
MHAVELKPISYLYAVLLLISVTGVSTIILLLVMVLVIGVA